MIRRQLINFQNRSIDVRVGFNAFSELSRMFASAVGKPKRAMVVWNSAVSDRFGEIVEHALVDAALPCRRSSSRFRLPVLRWPMPMLSLAPVCQRRYLRRSGCRRWRCRNLLGC